MLSICTSPPTMLRFWLIMGGELEQIFGNIHPTFANFKVSSGIWISKSVQSEMRPDHFAREYL